MPSKRLSREALSARSVGILASATTATTVHRVGQRCSSTAWFVMCGMPQGWAI